MEPLPHRGDWRPGMMQHGVLNVLRSVAGNPPKLADPVATSARAALQHAAIRNSSFCGFLRVAGHRRLSRYGFRIRRHRPRIDVPGDGQGGARPHALNGERRLTPDPRSGDARSACPVTSGFRYTGRARYILRISHAGNESCLSDSACQPVGTFLAKLTPRGLLIESTIGRA
jgi:hypothetical protein